MSRNSEYGTSTADDTEPHGPYVTYLQSLTESEVRDQIFSKSLLP